jgi:hypothetical protein
MVTGLIDHREQGVAALAACVAQRMRQRLHAKPRIERARYSVAATCARASSGCFPLRTLISR